MDNVLSPPFLDNSNVLPFKVDPVTNEFVSSINAETSTLKVVSTLFPLKYKLLFEYVPPLTKVSVVWTIPVKFEPSP